MRYKTPIIALAICTVAISCEWFDGDESRVTRPVAFESVAVPGGFQPAVAGAQVFQDQESWAEFYVAHTPTDGPVPEFDFERSTLIAVHWGEIGCEFHAPGVDAITAILEPEPSRVEVHVLPLEHLGNVECLAPHVPYQLLTTERLDLPVSFTGDVPGDTLQVGEATRRQPVPFSIL